MPPATTAIGALINHITGGHIVGIDPGPRSFQPMNVNFGLFPPIGEAADDECRRPPAAGSRKGRRAKPIELSRRAARDLDAWLADPAPALAAE